MLQVTAVRTREDFKFLSIGRFFKRAKQVLSTNHHLWREVTDFLTFLLKGNHFFEEFHFRHREDASAVGEFFAF
jgi:hypothetical protein